MEIVPGRAPSSFSSYPMRLFENRFPSLCLRGDSQIILIYLQCSDGKDHQHGVYAHLNLLTATAGDVRRLLEAGAITSVELVKLYLKQIARHNREGVQLNAMISVVPKDLLLEEAKKPDAERAETGPRSRMHGIPIILKV